MHRVDRRQFTAEGEKADRLQSFLISRNQERAVKNLVAHLEVREDL